MSGILEQIHKKFIEHTDQYGMIMRKKAYLIVSVNFPYIKSELFKLLEKHGFIKWQNKKKFKVLKKSERKEAKK